MNLARFNAVAFAFLFAIGVGAARPAGATDTGAALDQIEAQNKAFSAAYENGDVPKMKAAIKKAVSLGEKSGIAADPVMAETYVFAAILEVDGNENTAAGVKYFVKALKLKPDLAIPKGMGTSTVKAALKQARAEAGEAPKEAAPAVAAAAAPAPAKAAEKTEPAAKAAEEQAPKEQAAAKPAKEDKAAQKEQEKLDKQKAAEQARADADAKKQEKVQEKQRAADQARADADAKKQEKEDAKALAEAKTRAQQLEKDKADRDKALADSKGRAQQLEKDRADRDKALADAKARAQQLEKDKADRDKALADAKTRIQQLEKDKADRDKALADAKARIQQLEKENSEHGKALADAKAREGKEREAREKVEHERQIAEAKEREVEARKKQEQESRERLFAGPALPARITEPLLCEVPDEAPLRTDLFVHCVARPNVKATGIVFYYRVAGSAHYYSVPMQRTSKGWYAALVPGVRVVGKVMQYYAEAMDTREAVVARNGKENSPNILTLKPGAPRG